MEKLIYDSTKISHIAMELCKVIPSTSGENKIYFPLYNLTEIQKMNVYFVAFGKHYNEQERKLHPLSLNIAFSIALRRISEQPNFNINNK